MHRTVLAVCRTAARLHSCTDGFVFMGHQDCNFDRIAQEFCARHETTGSRNVQKIKELCIALKMKIEEEEGNVRKEVQWSERNLDSTIM